jgi:hypothetical protein
LTQPQLIEMERRFKKALAAEVIEGLAEASGFTERPRDVTPAPLVTALLCALGALKVETIADVHRTYKAVASNKVQYKPFHNQLAKEAFPEFMRRVLCHVVTTIATRVLRAVPASVLERFDDIILQDGSSFAVHDALADVYPGRFTKVSPAAVELHVTMSVLEDRPVGVSLAPDSVSERKFLPAPASLRRKLILADRGYEDIDYCAAVDREGGSFIIRFKANANPTILRARDATGIRVRGVEGKRLKDVRAQFAGKTVDLDVEWQRKQGPVAARLVLTWNPAYKQHMALVTNLPPSDYTASVIRTLYSLRWQVELLFKEWKSYANLHRFTTTKAAIAEGLMWAALTVAALKRFFAHAAQLVGQTAISTRATAMALGLHLGPLLRAVLRGHDITQLLAEALDFLRHAAPRANPARERKRGRLQAGLEPCLGVQ